MSQISYAAVAAGASPTTTTNPQPPPPQGTLNASAQGSSTTTTPTTATYTKATPDLKKPAKDGSDAPPAYGAEGTFPVHPQPDVEAFPQLPSHNGREGGGGPPPPTPHPNSTAQNGSTAYHMHYREPTWLRFIKALGTAVLIYLLASMLVESMYLAAHWGMGRHRHHDHLPRNYDVPADVKLHQCATSRSWQKAYPSLSSDNSSTEYPYAARTSFSIPLGYADEATVVVLSRGRWLSGNVNVVSSATQEWGQVSVDVTVKYFRDNARDEVRACLVEREDGGRGVGIFTPEHKWDWNDDHKEHQVYYETTLVLPEGVPVLIKKLETDVPNSSLHLNLDGTHVVFDDVVLKGSNAHVQIDVPLAAKKASIQYTDSPIVGHFNVTDELTIETSNARVEASVTMYRIQKYDNIPSLDITTSNGVLHTNILLLDDPSSSLSNMKSTHPHYNIKTATSNAQLDVSFTGAPIDAVLSFEGSTKNGGASARLYQTYSGSYEIWTRNSAADLIVGCPGGIEVPPKASQQLIVNDGKVEKAVGGGKACKGGVTMVRDEISKKNYKRVWWSGCLLTVFQRRGLRAVLC
ncbi:hypothetical protein BKA70DRAFT_119945 [Coprinopsis sp. MPI-PUGE-AT-0042]|nr:hypothetical protein BKA70DRAFT_119945 [Coprinopsis sp. MPI-PUGE-AT-0042]